VLPLCLVNKVEYLHHNNACFDQKQFFFTDILFSVDAITAKICHFSFQPKSPEFSACPEKVSPLKNIVIITTYLHGIK